MSISNPGADTSNLNGIAVKMIPVLLIVLFGILFMFNQNTQAVYEWYEVTNRSMHADHEEVMDDGTNETAHIPDNENRGASQNLKDSMTYTLNYILMFFVEVVMDPENPDYQRPIFLPHHILFIGITIGMIIVFAFAFFILSSIDDSNSYKSESYSDF